MQSKIKLHPFDSDILKEAQRILETSAIDQLNNEEWSASPSSPPLLRKRNAIDTSLFQLQGEVDGANMMLEPIDMMHHRNDSDSGVDIEYVEDLVENRQAVENEYENFDHLDQSNGQFSTSNQEQQSDLVVGELQIEDKSIDMAPHRQSTLAFNPE